MVAPRLSHERRAGNGVWSLGVLYTLHAAYVCVIGPINERASSTFPIFVVVAVTVVALCVWAGLAVRRGGRLLGAVLLTCIILAGGAIATAGAVKSMWITHPWFVVLESVITLWGIATLVLLVRVQVARDARIDESGGSSAGIGGRSNNGSRSG